MVAMTGRMLGHYRIDSKLGEGGMGVVYRAFDTHLDRAVAIKVLRPDAVANPERRRRFVQEAKSASALNHPGIVHIYDINTAELPEGATDYIAMEFVAGHTLDRSIGKKGLSLKEALHYGIQVADALASAHAAGIVHRDLKPANIIVGDDGRVKLLDFGLAKLAEKIELDAGGATETMTATENCQTGEGVIVGTPAYMSPEQAEGKKVDGRSDIFSFGAVLYEMVTGRRAFEGPTKVATISAILHKEPRPAGEVVSGLPAEFERVIARCLRKEPERRAQNIADVKLALEDLKDESESGRRAAPAVAGPTGARSRLGLAVIAGGLLAAAAGLAWWLTRATAPARTGSDWVQITNLPDSAVQPALSPDGRMVTFIRGSSSFVGPGQVYVKMLPAGEPVQLTHDDRAKFSPVFSPDGSRIVYAVTGGIWDTWSVQVLGGEPRLWLPNASGLTWVDKSRILFSEIKDGAHHMALVTSDESRAGSRDIFVPPHRRGMAHRSYLSPDGKQVLMVEMNELGSLVGCRMVPMDGSSPGKPVGPQGGRCLFAAWSPDGTWMYFNSDSGGDAHIWRQRYPDGEPEQITFGPTQEEGIAMAADGRSFLTAVGLTYSSVWVHDAKGDRQISLEGYAFGPKFTPDGKRLIYRVRKGNINELWIADLDSGRSEPLLPGLDIASSSGHPRGYDISPDGRRVVLASPDSGGKMRLWLAPLDRSAPRRQIAGIEGEQPVFGGNGEIFFRKVDGAYAFLYRVNEDGSGLRKANDLNIVAFRGGHPDRHVLMLGITPIAGGEFRGAALFRIDGGTTVRTQIPGPMEVAWSGDGKHFVVQRGASTMLNAFVFPVTRDQPVPDFFLRSFPSELELAKVPGVRSIASTDVALGPTAEVYAFTRQSIQRNLYRVPLR